MRRQHRHTSNSSIDRTRISGAIVDALASEPDTAGRLIALANSDLFKNQRHSANLHQAVANLGTHDALILSVVCEVFTTLQAFPAGTADHDAFIQCACIAAAWGKTIADEFGRSDSTELLLAAMVQDIGLLWMAHGKELRADTLMPMSGPVIMGHRARRQVPPGNSRVDEATKSRCADQTHVCGIENRQVPAQHTWDSHDPASLRHRSGTDVFVKSGLQVRFNRTS